MKQLSLAFVLLLSSFLPAAAEEPVNFGDRNLRLAVEESLWIADPTPSDMLGLFYLDVTAKEIYDLTGLEYATNLLTLRLGDNQRISDIGPLRELTNLSALVLSQNRISDITPLAGLVNLEELDLHHNEFDDISALSGLTRLYRLSLRENSIRDISALSGLTRLEDLIISITQVSNIPPLLGLRSLRRLDLRGCPLNQAAYDVHIPQIRANNPGIQILYEAQRWPTVTLSSSAGGSVIYPGEGAFVFEYGRSVSLVARADPGFVFLNWSGGYSGTQSSTTITMAEDYEIRANFLSLSRSLFVDNRGTGNPGGADLTVADPLEDGTPQHPFDRIQEAIEVAADGTSIFVRPGTYRENIDLLGKNILVTGIDPNDTNGAPYPVIEGAAAGPIVRFTHGEGPGCTLTGFVLTRGKDDLAGAVHCDASSPTIAHCVIVGNCSTQPNGAAVYCRDSHAVLVNCTIVDNVAAKQGAGLYLVNSDIVLTNSIVWGNRPDEIRLAGTGAPSITYSDIAGGWTGTGILDQDPLFAKPGYWANPDDPDVMLDPTNPNAIWIEGDYHLRSQAGRWDRDPPYWFLDVATSPCIDTGDPSSPVGAEPAPNGSRIDLGAYGGTPQASKSPANP